MMRRFQIIAMTGAALLFSVSMLMAQETPPAPGAVPAVEAAQETSQPQQAPAQADAQAVAATPVGLKEGRGDGKAVLTLAPGELNPNDIPSVVFTYWEHTAIRDARRARGMVRPPTEEELTKDLKEGPETFKVKPPPEERDITLGGIVYVSPEDWTIWLNGKRVTPKALPKEAIDLKVYDGYIEMKWFDEYTNQIFPLRLRPHERFNIDTRIFLPG